MHAHIGHPDRSEWSRENRSGPGPGQDQNFDNSKTTNEKRVLLSWWTLNS